MLSTVWLALLRILAPDADVTLPVALVLARFVRDDDIVILGSNTGTCAINIKRERALTVRVGACSDALAAHADLLEPPVHTAMYAPRAHAVTVVSQTYATVGRRRAALVAVELESNSTKWRPVSHPATPYHNRNEPLAKTTIQPPPRGRC